MDGMEDREFQQPEIVLQTPLPDPVPENRHVREMGMYRFATRGEARGPGTETPLDASFPL